MAFPSSVTRVLNFLPLGHAKDTLMNTLSQYLSLLDELFPFKQNYEDFQQDQDDDHQEDRPSASMVPVPVSFMIDSIKEQLPVAKYSQILEKRANNQDLAASVCIVCLNCVEASHEVRELYHCSHVFHRECLDVWIEQGQGTCPMCRSKLLPDQKDKVRNGGDDPWRKERMIFLFGEDCDMCTF